MERMLSSWNMDLVLQVCDIVAQLDLINQWQINQIFIELKMPKYSHYGGFWMYGLSHRGHMTHTYRGRIMYALEWRTVSTLTRGLFWCLFPELQSNSGNKHQNNTRVRAETVRHESTYILFLTRHSKSVNDDKNDDLYTSSPSLTHSVVILLMTS